MYDDCNEAVEYCTADPRRTGCGPSCDGPGICIPYGDVCGWDTRRECGEGMECFFGSADDWTNGVPGDKIGCVQWQSPEDGQLKRQCRGMCLPLRFGSDYYKKTSREEIKTDEWNGYQEPGKGNGAGSLTP